jgi:hypothetical protein
LQIYVFINQTYPKRTSDQVSSVRGETCQPDTFPLQSLFVAGEAVFPNEDFPRDRTYVASIDRNEIDAALKEHEGNASKFTIFAAICVDYRMGAVHYKTGIHYALQERTSSNEWGYMVAPPQDKTVPLGNWGLQRVPNGFAR